MCVLVATIEPNVLRDASPLLDATTELTNDVQVVMKDVEEMAKKPTGDATTASVELAKKKDSEFSKLRNEFQKAVSPRDDDAATMEENKKSCDKLQEDLDTAKKLNRALLTEIDRLTEQLSSGGGSNMEEIRRKLGLENEELQAALEEEEVKTEQLEAKVVKLEQDLTQFKQATERIISEKDEDLKFLRKRHAQQMESLQNTIDAQQRAKAESAKAQIEVVQRARETCDEEKSNLEREMDLLQNECQLQIEEYCGPHQK
jgi:DNA repair exonuclease SbcCD ATPase subunit